MNEEWQRPVADRLINTGLKSAFRELKNDPLPFSSNSNLATPTKASSMYKLDGAFSFMYHVYILFSPGTSRFYVGQTQDLNNRLKEHNSGESTSTARGRPRILVWSTQLHSRSEAMKLEKKIKSRGASRFLSDQGIAWR
jgi:putative endonuclease